MNASTSLQGSPGKINKGLRPTDQAVNSAQGSPASHRYLTYAEAGALYSVGRSKLQRLVVAGIVEAYRPGKEILLDRISLEHWFLSTRIQPRRRLGRPRKGAPRL